jgi:ketosteroid isomerase-like protein
MCSAYDPAMTESTNSELLRLGYAAWNAGDLEGWLERLYPEIRIETSGMFPDLASEYVGHSRARTFWRQMHEPWERFAIDVEHVEDEGDEWAIASIRFLARGADSGVEVDMRFGMAMHARDGLAVELLNKRNFDEARKAMHSATARERGRARA